MSSLNDLKTFISDKPYPVSIEMRPLWRIGLILISIYVVSGEKKYLDLKKVNILVWMLIRKSRWGEYEDYLCGRSFEIPLVSVDTATYKAIEFSIAKELIHIEDGRLHITKDGEELFSILIENEIMIEEISYLEKVGKKLSSSKVKSLTGGLI